jgi:hypothetical protein
MFWPVSRPLIFLGHRYFYRATFESYGLEIGHLAAVITEGGSEGLLPAGSDGVFTKLTLTPLGSGKQDTNGPCIFLFPDMGSFGKFFLLYTAPKKLNFKLSNRFERCANSFFDNSLIALHSFSFTQKINDLSSLLRVRSIYKSDVPSSGFTNRKWKYVKEKTTTTLKCKQTSIATVRYHVRTFASFSTLPIFHWSLPLMYQLFKCCGI